MESCSTSSLVREVRLQAVRCHVVCGWSVRHVTELLGTPLGVCMTWRFAFCGFSSRQWMTLRHPLRQRVSSSLTLCHPPAPLTAFILARRHFIPSCHPGKKGEYSRMRERERDRSSLTLLWYVVMIVHMIVLLPAVVHLLLCMVYKLNFIPGLDV